MLAIMPYVIADVSALAGGATQNTAQ